MLFIPFFILSLVICIVISSKLQHIEELEIYDVKKWSIINEIVFILGIVAAIMSILLSVLSILLPFYILLCIWHIKHIKKLNKIKAEKSTNSVLYCKQCGMAVPNGTEFCTKCGNKLESE